MASYTMMDNRDKETLEKMLQEKLDLNATVASHFNMQRTGKV